MKTVVPGSGIVGVTTACFLAKAGEEVIVVESQPGVAPEPASGLAHVGVVLAIPDQVHCREVAHEYLAQGQALPLFARTVAGRDGDESLEYDLISRGLWFEYRDEASFERRGQHVDSLGQRTVAPDAQPSGDYCAGARARVRGP
ncbi:MULTISPECIES: FAD-dependent oxidoreductase [Paraburkholderia]|uniref:FAD-dependent oxidoreductase n=1 Tax=Paraburkholderia metrosideri TaxID=580937 RepID=A0ABW9E652_9BURK